MVLEQVFRINWIEKKPLNALWIGMLYSFIGIFSSYFVFPVSLGITSIAFAALLLLPTLNRLLSLEENEDVREKKLSLKLLFKDHWDIIQVFIFMFIGIFLTYFLVAVLLSQSTVSAWFSTQLAGSYFAGAASQGFSTFWSYIAHNSKVLFWCFAFSLIYGAGSIFFLTWNASVWGAFFGMATKTGSGSVFLASIPHAFLEGLSYFVAIVGGGIFSKAMTREKFGSKKFNHVFTDGIIFFVIAFMILVFAAAMETWGFRMIYGMLGN
ncbi:MAG: stage II sporulation protein M [Candidatus Woesearchaeota archaeon]